MRKSFLLVTCVAALVLMPHDAHAQTEEEFGIWNALFATGQVRPTAPSLVFWFDAHGRREDTSSTVILRPGVGYQIRPWMSVWLGYAWVSVFADPTSTRGHEHRIWEQLTLDYRDIPGLLVQSRTRFEQRFDSGDVGHRLRQLARVNYQPKSSVPFGLVLWDEVFIGLGGSSRWTTGFDQNRLFAGPAFFAFDGMFRAELGYQYVHLSRAVNRNVHLLVINLFVNFRG